MINDVVRNYMLEEFVSVQDLIFFGFVDTGRYFADSKVFKKVDTLLLLDVVEPFIDVYKCYFQVFL